jgi:hypothetical protein
MMCEFHINYSSVTSLKKSLGPTEVLTLTIRLKTRVKQTKGT